MQHDLSTEANDINTAAFAAALYGHIPYKVFELLQSLLFGFTKGGSVRHVIIVTESPGVCNTGSCFSQFLAPQSLNTKLAVVAELISDCVKSA